LDFRNDEMAIKNSTVVQSILLAAGSESESLKRIAEKTQVDSRTMKILSRIALIYLPANLIAVCVPLLSEKLNFFQYISHNKKHY